MTALQTMAESLAERMPDIALSAVLLSAAVLGFSWAYGRIREKTKK